MFCGVWLVSMPAKSLQVSHLAPLTFWGFSVEFNLSEEQVLLRDSVARFVSDTCTVERHRRLSNTELGFDAAAWRVFADLGWLHLPFPEEQGGLGGSAADVMVVSEALGRGLVREPFLHVAIVCGGFLRLGCDAAQRARYLPGLMDGSSQWAFAFAEQGSGYNLAAIDTTATATSDGWRLCGEKIAVLNGHCADYIIVTANTGGTPGLYIVDTSMEGVHAEPFTAVDGSRGAVIRLQDALVDSIDKLSGSDDALALVESVIDHAIVAMGGEALGAMQVLLDATVEYAKTREQFGQPIGKFQALQHRMAEMYLRVEETRSLLLNAAIQVDQGSDEAASACAALKVKIAEAGSFVSRESVQLHGGIGMTDELVVGHQFKRLMLLSKLFGDEDYYLQRFEGLAAADDRRRERVG